MQTTSPHVRGKASLFTAGGFALLLAVLVLIGMSVPPIGMLVYGTLYWASPFAWAWALVAGIDAPWPIDRTYLPIVFAAPFPVVGLLVGFLWPFRVESATQTLNAIGMRFAVALGVMLVLGVGIFVMAL